MPSLLSSYLTSSYSLSPQGLLPIGIPYPSWPSWHAGQSSGHSFKCGFLINRETPVSQEGAQTHIFYVIVIYRLWGMNTSIEMTWGKIAFLRKSPTTQRDSCQCALSSVPSFDRKVSLLRLSYSKIRVNQTIFEKANGDWAKRVPAGTRHISISHPGLERW